MTKTILRLEFEQVFPEKEPMDLIYYLSEISNESLLSIIGFSNTHPQPNYDNFFTNPVVKEDIILRVNKFCFENNIPNKPVVISREGSLRLAEKILSNKNVLIKDDKVVNVDKDEFHLFVAFTLINKEINSRLKIVEDGNNFDKLVDIHIVLSFSSSDLGNFEGNNKEFAKLIFATLIRFELLVEFLKSKVDFNYLEQSLYEYFNLESTDELLYQVKYLFGKLLLIKVDNSFKFVVEENKAELFLNSLVAEKISEDDDFTNLKNYPVYKVEEKVYSVVDYYFVVDKFYKSVRFILKDNFNKFHNLPANDRSFFRFYNTEFSEQTLMKSLLDSIFHQKFLVKHIPNGDSKNEPDYYVRHNNKVYLFENKDVLIAKNVKVSGDINQIDDVLKERFLLSNNKPIGIGQLINSIEQITNKTFKFDDYVNSKNNISVYPILLVSDRIFEIPGINYKLNKWYLESLREKIGDKYNPSLIKKLTLIDIDTLIYWTPFLSKKPNNLGEIIDNHLKQMTTEKKVRAQNKEEAIVEVSKNIGNQLNPISYRFNSYKFPHSLLVEKFLDAELNKRITAQNIE